MDIKFKENNLIKKSMNNDQLKIGIRFLTKNIPFIGLLSIVLLVSLLSDVFLTSFNLLNVLRQASINGLIAFGMMAVILSAGIDLSVGSTLAVSSVVMAQLILAGYPTTLAITVALLIGVIIGLLNGLLIAKGKLQPMIATLSTMLVFRGVTLYISNGVPVSKLGEGLIGWLGRGSFIGIPVPVYILFIIFIIFALMLKYTVIGKQIYAVGGNSKAAMLSGINVDRTILIVYSLSGLFAALAGIILTSRIDSAVPTAGQTFELNAIAAVVIGGASLTGGRGRAVGTLSGALIIAVIANGLNLLGTSAYIQQIVTGVIIILAVIFDRKK
jgi:ribose transport system permease protein